MPLLITISPNSELGLTEDIDSLSASASVSFASTRIFVLLFSIVFATSSWAMGAWFTTM